jgi:hypothetical protein
MRTTLTLDDDVAAALEQLRKDRNISLKEAVNEAIRSGLQKLSTPRQKKAPFRTESHDLGHSLIGNLDNIGEVLAIAEGEDYR